MKIDFSLFKSNDQSTISTALLQTLLDNITTGIEVLKAVRKDSAILDFEYILANEIAQKRSGSVKLIGKKFLSRPDGHKHLFSRMVEVVETGNSYQVLVTSSAYGAPRWFIHKYVKFGDDIVLTIIDDITEKKISEQAALDTQEFIENIADSTPDIIYVLDLETRTFIYMNNRGYDMLGITEKEIKEKGHDIFFQIIHPDDYVRRMNHYTQMGNEPSDTIQEIDVRKKVKDGSYHWFRARDKVFRRNKDGAAISIIGIATDIQEKTQSAIDLVSSQQQAKEQLQEKSHFLERIQETVPDMISVTNLATHQFEYINRETFKLHGFDPEHMNKRTREEMNDIIYIDDRQVLAEYFQNLSTASDNDVITAEYRARDDQGQWKWFLVRGRPFQRNEAGIVTHVINVIANITARKKAEQEILLLKDERTQRLADKYLHLFNSIDEGFCVVEVIFNHKEEAVDYLFLEANPAFIKQTALPDAIGKSIKEIAPQHEEFWFRTYGEIVKTGQSQRFEHYASQIAGGVWYDVYAFRVGKPEDHMVAILFNDITLRKKAEQQLKDFNNLLEQQIEERTAELKQNRNLLHSVFDSATNGFSVLEAVRNKKGTITDFRYKYVNRTTEMINNGRDLIGQLYSKMHKGFKKVGLFDNLVSVVETGETGRMELFYDEEGFQNWFSTTAVKLGDGVVLSFEDITSRKNTEQIRRDAAVAILQQNASLENFKRIIDTTHDGIISLDNDERINYWNRASELIYGYTSGEVMGKKLDDLIVIESRKQDLQQAMIQVYQRGKSIVNMVMQKRKKDGRIIDVLINLFPLKDETGSITGSCMVTKDVSEAKISKEKIKEDAHFIGQIADITPDIIYIMDLNTHQMIYTNRQVAAELGYSKQQIASMKNPVLDIVHEGDLPAVIAHLTKMKTLTRDDKVLEIEYRMKNAGGGITWFCDRNTVFKRNSKKIPVEKIGFSQNITERKEQEEKILTGLDILSQAEEIGGMGSWKYEIETGNFKWSEGMYRLFNIPEGTKVEPEIYFDYAPNIEKDKVKKIIDNIMYSYHPFEETLSLLIPGNEKKIIKIKAVAVKDRKNKPVKMVGVDLDITTQVKAAEEINELNKTLMIKNLDLLALNTELKTFNTITSSDYKETLQILYTNLEYIVSKDARRLGDSSKANIRRAQSAIQKMKLLTEDINTYLQLYDVGISKSMIDPNNILQNVLSTMRPKLEQTSAKVEISPLPGMPADPFLFSRLMTNLIDNAIKFRKLIVPPVIKIKYSRADEINAIPGALQDTPYIIISVADNGLGFSENIADKVFDLFFRAYPSTQYKGSGIGLAVCKKIMAMHGGFITGESVSGMGSIFSCYFPDNL